MSTSDKPFSALPQQIVARRAVDAQVVVIVGLGRAHDDGMTDQKRISPQQHEIVANQSSLRHSLEVYLKRCRLKNAMPIENRL